MANRRSREQRDGGRTVRRWLPALLWAAFAAVAALVGHVCTRATAEDAWRLHWPFLPVSAAFCVALAGVLLACAMGLFAWLDGVRVRGWRSFDVQGPFTRHAFAICLVLFLAAWLPYLVVFAPGSLVFDGVRSLNQFLAGAPLQNHHPVVMNLLYAGLFSVGRVFGDNGGVAAIVAFQTLASAVAFAALCSQLVRMRAPRVLVVAAVVFFALWPGWGLSAQAAFKDTLFNAVMCWFVIALVRVMAAGVDRAEGLGESGSSELVAVPMSRWASLLLAALALCFTRNNGIYLAAPTLLCGAWWLHARRGAAAVESRGRAVEANARMGDTGAMPAVGGSAGVGSADDIDAGADAAVGQAQSAEAGARVHRAEASGGAHAWSAVLAVLAIVLAVYLAATKLLFPMMGVEMREDKERLSVPFQQTARYLLEHPDDVTDQERAAIDAILPCGELAELYLPSLADPVKESVRDAGGNLTAEQRNAYFAAWCAMGLRHPGSYVRATLANTWAYFYPGAIVGPDVDRPVFSLYTLELGQANNESFDVHYLQPDEVRGAVSSWMDAQLDAPVLRALYSPATYVLLMLLACAYAARRRDRGALVVALPALLLLLTTLAGPLNGHLRYMLPLVAVLPLVWWCAVGGMREGAACSRARALLASRSWNMAEVPKGSGSWM